MNLLSVLKKIVILETEHKNYRPTVIFSKIVDNKLIQLISTKHQKIDRFGNHSYDDLVSIYQDYLDTRKSKYQNPPRIGVPDSMVKNFFENNVEKIYQTFETEKPENNQIIFVKKRKDKVFLYPFGTNIGSYPNPLFPFGFFEILPLTVPLNVLYVPFGKAIAREQ